MKNNYKTISKPVLMIVLSTALCLWQGTVLSQSVLPKPNHIVIAIFENHAYQDIIGSSAAPYINALANDSNSALFTQYYGIEHPSQPNYLDLYSGCNQGVVNDNVPGNIPFTTVNLGRQLIDTGKTFATYFEDLPSVGFNGASSGNYARKHNPAANWMGTGTNQIPTTTNQPLFAFPTYDFSQLPTVSYVVPNQNNDMHNGSDPARITTGDSWFYNNLNAYIQWAKTNNSLFVLTYDEDDLLAGNQIVTIFNGPMVKGGQYAQTLNHYSLLRTIEDMYGLAHACNASSATSVSDCWILPTAITEPGLINPGFTISPNPATNQINITIDESLVGSTLNIYNLTGELVQTELLSTVNRQLSTESLPPGVYIAEVKTKQGNMNKRWVKM